MPDARTRASTLAVVAVAAMGLGVLVGFWVPDDEFYEMRKHFRIFGAVYEELVTGYVEPVDPSHLMRTGVEAMLAELDPYTTFLDEADNADLTMMTQGRYGGVGVEIGRRGPAITVVGPVDQAGGFRQGVRTGDVITSVSGQSTDSLSVEDVETLLQGEPGTTVEVTVERAGRAMPLSITLTRQRVDLEDVSYRGRVGADAEIGYVKLERFTRDAAVETQEALRTLRAGGTLAGVILDLRGNPGGLLGAAVDVASLFVPEGATVVSTDGRTSKAQATFRSERAPLLPDLPVVVLVDGTSASASEIVAGAMQDHERGVVLGTPTYGKGLVQTVRRLPYNTALKMTTAQYFTPDGRAIQSLRTGGSDASAGAGQDGIAPDSTVQPPASDGVVEALKRQAAFFYYANHYAATRDTLAEDFAVTAETVASFRDWLEAEDRTVRVEAERQARSLRRTLSEDGYEEAVDEAEALEAAVHAATMAAFDDHTAALKAELRRAILARYVDNARVTQATLPHDPQVGAAVSVLRNSAQYKSLLSPDSR